MASEEKPGKREAGIRLWMLGIRLVSIAGWGLLAMVCRERSVQGSACLYSEIVAVAGKPLEILNVPGDYIEIPVGLCV